MATKTKRTAREKLLDDKDLPRLETIPAKLHATWGRGKFVIARPRDVDALMRRVPKGKLTTVDELRAALAAMHGADTACPMTTGIFVNLAAKAADEAESEGRTRVTPYWRTLKARGELNAKFPGGVEHVRARLEAEGHEVVARGKRLFVADHTARLVRPRQRA